MRYRLLAFSSHASTASQCILLVVGDTIPQRDVPKLEVAGTIAVYPTGTPLEDLVESMRALA